MHSELNEETVADVRRVLDVTRRSAIAEFEKLPLDRDITILRNILYEGLEMNKKSKRYSYRENNPFRNNNRMEKHNV